MLLQPRAQPATFVKGTSPSAAAYCVKGITAPLRAEFYQQNSAAQPSRTPPVQPRLRHTRQAQRHPKEGPTSVPGTAAPRITGDRQAGAGYPPFPLQCVTNTFPNLLLSPRARPSPSQGTNSKSHCFSETEGQNPACAGPHPYHQRPSTPWASTSNSAPVHIF